PLPTPFPYTTLFRSSEYAPKKYKSLMVTVVYCGFTLGAAGGGFLATHLIADYGWASILVVGGVVPIGFAGLLLLILPESAKFLAARQKRHAELRNIINRMSAGTVGEQTLLLSSERHTNDCGAIRQILSKAH